MVLRSRSTAARPRRSLLTRALPSLGCAVLATAAVMFPAGLWVADALRPEAAPVTERPLRAPASPRTPVRNPYSATIRTDPHVLDAQRAVVEAMERACKREQTQCPEAAAARRYLNDRLAEGS